jgi:energy-coupling factor transport system permease protein
MFFKLLAMAESLITYEPVDSYLHRLHPLTKMTLLIFVIVGGMYVSGPNYPWILNFVILILLITVAVTGKIPLGKELRERGAYILVIVTILFFGNLIFARGGEESYATNPNVKIYFEIPPFIYATSVGLNYAISKTILILSSIIVIIILMKSTRLADLTHALNKVGVPYSVATITATSLRCVPMVVDGLLIVYNAERARGMELDKGGARARIKQWQQLITPLMMVLMKWVDQMTVVFQSRGLDFSSKKRTRLRTLPFRTSDLLITTTLIIVLVGFITANLLGLLVFNVY